MIADLQQHMRVSSATAPIMALPLSLLRTRVAHAEVVCQLFDIFVTALLYISNWTHLEHDLAFVSALWYDA